MKRIHRMIVGMLPGPFLGWLGTLMFLLLMQFLIRYLKEIVGKGLPPGVIVELISYNLAYMVVLAVPMSILIATLMAFGKLGETRAYLVVKTAGVSVPRLIWPALVFGLVLTGCMTYFNNEVLPEANFRAKNLWQDIHRKKPGFDLKPGMFYSGLNGYHLLVRERPPESNELFDVTIYDYTEGIRRQAVIKARRGRLYSVNDGLQLDLELEDGEIHRRIEIGARTPEERYERLAFGRYRLRLDLSDLAFERSNPGEGYRSDRTMRTEDMIRFVDSLDASIAEQRAELRKLVRLRTVAGLPPEETAPLLPAPDPPANAAAPPVVAYRSIATLTPDRQRDAFTRALQHARTLHTSIDDTKADIDWESSRAARYRVEIHKKFSIALACLIFALIGAPLGLSIRRGGLGTMGGLATAIFLFYWVTLVQGEKLADRGYLEPWVGMWAANLVMIGAGLWLVLYVTLDLRATPPLRRRLRRRLRRLLGRENPTAAAEEDRPFASLAG